jgi:polyhydroxyalkanoate synthesis repressor PhaR
MCDPHDEYLTDQQRYENIASWVLNILAPHDKDSVYILIEDYAFAAQGRVFNLAENCGLLKYLLYKNGYKFSTIAPSVIKKYANRRLYNTGTSTYVTLDDLAVMVKKGEEFTVQDAKSGEDITHSVLTQIIFEQESKTGNTLLPISFLRQLISYYGDQMQMVVPSYLEHSMQAFGEQQSQMREQITRAFGDNPLAKNLQLPIQMVEEQVRRNTDMFQQAMQMFTPFGAPAAPRETKKAEAKDIDELKEQLRLLQTKLDNL